MGPFGWLAGRSRWFWIVATLIGLPLLYVLSFGPAMWAAERNIIPSEACLVVYDPLISAMWDGPEWVSIPLQNYYCVFLDDERAEQFKHAIRGLRLYRPYIDSRPIQQLPSGSAPQQPGG